jgi:hypothetical protein
MRSGCAPQTSPYPPGSSWRCLKRRNSTGSSRAPFRLAHQARPIRQCWTGPTLSRLLPPSPATPGSGCLQLHPTATTARPRRSLTSIRYGSASWRTARGNSAGCPRLPRQTHQRALGTKERRRRPDDRHIFIRRGWPSTAMGGLSATHREPLCEPSFPQVERDRQGRSNAFSASSFRAVPASRLLCVPRRGRLQDSGGGPAGPHRPAV